MDQNKKTPQVRFKGHTDTWEQRKLGEVAPLRGGYAFKSDEYKTEGTPIVRISNILSDGSVGAEFAYYDDIEDDENITLGNGDALLAMSGATTGKVSILKCNNIDKYYQNQRVGYFERNEQYNYGFVSTIVRSDLFKEQLTSVLVAGAQPNVSSKEIDSFEFMFPSSIEEQEKIGQYFQNFDNLITLHQRKYNKLLNMKKAMLEKMFPQNGSLYPEIRFKGFTDAWEQRKLRELVSFSKGSGYSKSDLKEVGTPIILYGRLYTKYETVISEVDTFVDEKTGSVYSKGGEVIVPGSGETAEDISIASVVEKPGILLGGDLNVITPPADINAAFLAISISNGKPHNDMAKMAQGKSVVHLHNSDLAKIDFPYPSYEEQCKIRGYFTSLDYLITLHQRKLEKLKNIKKSCLEKMFV